MKKTLLFLAAILISATALRAADEATVRVFVLKYKRVEEAALLIRPHLSESASVTLTQKLNAMTVTDRPEKLDQIGACSPPSTCRRAASRSPSSSCARGPTFPAGSIAREIGGLGAKLKSMFQFNDYALIDSVVLRVTDGGRVESQLGEEYVLSFTVTDRGLRQRAAAFALRPVPDLEVRRRRAAVPAAALPLLDAGDARRRRSSSAPRRRSSRRAP